MFSLPTNRAYALVLLTHLSRFLISVIAVLVHLRRKEVGDECPVVDDLALYEHPLVLEFFLTHQSPKAVGEE